MRYALWATPKGHTDALYDAILLSDATLADVEKVKPLATRDGWHSFKLQPLDGSRPNFAGCVNV